MADVTAGLTRLGVGPGDVVIAHTSLSAFGQVVGGARVLIAALTNVLGTAGTLVMPAHTPENAEPNEFEYPPLPRRQRQLWREHYPGFDPHLTPCREMGATSDLFRSWPGVRRSAHPLMSFCAWGCRAVDVLEPHELQCSLGEKSPLARLYALSAKILYLGTNHDSNTSFHLGEARSGVRAKRTHWTAIMEGGERRWLSYEDYDWDNTQFERIGEAFEATQPCNSTVVGDATLRVFPQAAVVDFAERWFRSNQAEHLISQSLPKVVDGDGVRLRLPLLDDSEWLTAQLGDDEAIKVCGVSSLTAEGNAEDFLCEALHSWAAGGGSWSWVVEDETSSPAGVIRLCRREHDFEVHVAIAAPFRKRGLGSKAVRLAAESALALPAVFRVVAHTDSQDQVAAKTITRAGFVREGLLRCHGPISAGNSGTPRDAVVYSRIKRQVT